MSSASHSISPSAPEPNRSWLRPKLRFGSGPVDGQGLAHGPGFGLSWADVRLALAATIAALVAMRGYLLQGDLASTLLPLFIFAGFCALPAMRRVESFTLIAWFMFFIIVLDEPHNNAFNEWDPITELLGPVLFERLRDMLDLPGFKITVFEVLTLSFAGWLAFSRGRNEIRNFIRDRPTRIVLLMAAVFPAATFVALVVGVLGGSDPNMALTQSRTLPVFGFWLYLGFVAYSSPKNIELIFKVILAATLIKCLEGWWAFFVEYHGAMGHREYLMEHITSEHIAISLLFVVALWWHRGKHKFHTLLMAGTTLILIVPYFLNLRRASFIGLGLTSALIPILYRRQVRLRHLVIAASALTLVGLIVAVLWNSNSPASALVYPLKRFFIKDAYFVLDYRDVENFNHYHSIMESPVFGRGFGFRLKMFLPLVDISALYPLYDVVPHNNVLFVWCNAGPLGIAAFASLVAYAFAVFLRLRRVAVNHSELLLAFLGWGMVLRWLIYVYADLGLAFFRLPALVGLVLGMAIKILGRSGGVKDEVACI